MNPSDRAGNPYRTAVNVGLGSVFAVLLGLTAYRISGEGRNWAFDAGVGIVVCAVALLREQHRGWAAAFGIVVSGAAGIVARIGDLPREPGVAATLALFVLAGSAARALPLRTAAVVAAGVVVLPVGWLIPARSGSSPTQVGAGIVGWCAALAIGVWLRSRDERRRAATEAVRREERLTLARELHDIVAHHITGVVLQAQAARVAARRHPEALEQTLSAIETAGTDAMAAMRRVVGLLRDADEGATTAPEPEKLSELVRRFNGYGPAVHLNLPAEDTLPPVVSTTVYRIVQESLTNIARHAPQAQTVTVSVAHGRDGVTIEITDDHPAGAHRRSHQDGFGLVGMRERIEALGGTLRAGPQPGAGWSVRATLPIGVGDHR